MPCFVDDPFSCLPFGPSSSAPYPGTLTLPLLRSLAPTSPSFPFCFDHDLNPPRFTGSCRCQELSTQPERARKGDVTCASGMDEAHLASVPSLVGRGFNDHQARQPPTHYGSPRYACPLSDSSGDGVSRRGGPPVDRAAVRDGLCPAALRPSRTSSLVLLCLLTRPRLPRIMLHPGCVWPVSPSTKDACPRVAGCEPEEEAAVSRRPPRLAQRRSVPPVKLISPCGLVRVRSSAGLGLKLGILLGSDL